MSWKWFVDQVLGIFRDISILKEGTFATQPVGLETGWLGIQEGSSSCLSNNQAAQPTNQPTNQPASRARNRQSAATKLHTFASCSLGPLCPGRSTGLWLVENNQLTEKLPFHWSALGRSHQGHARGDTALYQLLQQSSAARTVTCLGAKKAKRQNPIPANC